MHRVCCCVMMDPVHRRSQWRYSADANVKYTYAFSHCYLRGRRAVWALASEPVLVSAATVWEGQDDYASGSTSSSLLVLIAIHTTSTTHIGSRFKAIPFFTALSPRSLRNIYYPPSTAHRSFQFQHVYHTKAHFEVEDDTQALKHDSGCSPECQQCEFTLLKSYARHPNRA